MHTPRHTLTNFESALKALRSDVLTMAHLARRELEEAAKGLFERDEEACQTVIADDEEVDLFEIQIDRKGVDIIMRYQPVATDLRHVIASMKISINVERVADQAVNIARRARKLNRHPALPEIDSLKPMVAFTLEMFDDAFKAFEEGDLDIARKLKSRDKELDRMNDTLADQFVQHMQRDPKQLPGYLHLLLVARALERIGDQCTNIAEDAVYAFTAEDIRHQVQKIPHEPKE